MSETILFNLAWTLVAVVGAGLFLINIYLGMAVMTVWTIIFYWQVGYSKRSSKRRSTGKNTHRYRRIK